ncbi:uncharacterized protein BT62DRAFT_919302 [Guyanagaster necrorhizus]|uniref:Uncharacterized protein n=1 Tax=Guyanagaster necrorhizus TaxID=856835 RepID=A0A9P7VX19_9AGAR|nr:uncharacterized protein BT62DRAFT_919302 [Guyanagaster necrorhizus MCA 3950]KAG7447416.1 hypothetical protein BT62DRAFT_919302 [Guyanagaster necrorhizus MCA 3950]
MATLSLGIRSTPIVEAPELRPKAKGWLRLGKKKGSEILRDLTQRYRQRYPSGSNSAIWFYINERNRQEDSWFLVKYLNVFVMAKDSKHTRIEEPQQELPHHRRIRKNIKLYWESDMHIDNSSGRNTRMLQHQVQDLSVQHSYVVMAFSWYSWLVKAACACWNAGMLKFSHRFKQDEYLSDLLVT